MFEGVLYLVRQKMQRNFCYRIHFHWILRSAIFLKMEPALNVFYNFLFWSKSNCFCLWPISAKYIYKIFYTLQQCIKMSYFVPMQAPLIALYVTRYAIWYHLYNLKKHEKHPWMSVNFSNFTKINTPSWVFFTFFKLYKWYQIAQRITYL